MSHLAEYGPKLLELGYPIIPIRPRKKHPGFKGWQDVRADEAKLGGWLSNGFADGGVGVLAARFPAVDIDVLDSDIVDRLVAWCEDRFGAAPARVGAAPKTLLAFRTDEPFAKIASHRYADIVGREHKVEILGDGQQWVAYAVHPDTDAPYAWTSKTDLANTAPVDLPPITADDARALVAFFESIVPEDWARVEKSAVDAGDHAPATPERVLENAKPPLNVSSERLAAALDRLDPDMSMAEWVRIGMALWHQYDGGAEGFGIWDAWSAGGSKYDAKEMRNRWRSFEADISRTNPVTAATILQLAKEAAPRAAQTKFRLVHASDVLAKLGPINWRIEGYLEENTTGLVFGDPGSYKSFIALDMAFHVAAGKSWHGRPVTRGAVIYIAGEGHNGLARRFAAWQAHHGVDLSGLPFYASEQAAQFYNAESAGEVVAAVRAIADAHGAPAMIVIDTLARNFGPGDENSNTDLGVFLGHVDGMLRQPFGATVVIVHHTGHSNKERARGGMALKGGVDFEFRVEKKSEMAQLVCTKMKDGPEPSETWFAAEEVRVGDFDEGVTSLAMVPSMVPSMAPLPEPPKLKGKQLDLFELIRREAPVERETLRGIAVREGLFDSARGFRNTLGPLKEKGFVVESDTYISAAEEV